MLINPQKPIYLIIVVIILTASLAYALAETGKSKNAKIILSAPKISPAEVTKLVSYSDSICIVTITKIIVSDTSHYKGRDKADAIKVWANKPQIDENLQPYVRLAADDPVVELDGGTYSIRFNLIVDWPADKKDLNNGFVKIPVRAMLTKNGENSEVSTLFITLSIRNPYQKPD